MKEWHAEKVAIEQIAAWADDCVSQEWGKKAAARVVHICDSGRDIEIDDPFASGAATEKPIRYLNRVPGCPERAASLYDVSQAMSFVATHRKNTEVRAAWQAGIPRLLERLPTSQSR
jgi:hypothetical protein